MNRQIRSKENEGQTYFDIQVLTRRVSRLIFYFLVIHLTSSTVIAQQRDLVKESVQFNTPKTLYLVGEKIWFEAEVTSGSNPSPSQVLYAELVDRFSNSVAYTKVPLENGKALNYLLLSTAIPSDHYLLRVYTRISPYLDMNLGISQQFVTVINPKIPPKVFEKAQGNFVKLESTGADLGTVSNGNPKPGERFQVSFEQNSQILSAGISVSNPYLPGEQVQFKSSDAYASLEQKALLPELFGHIVESRVSKSDTSLTYFLSLHGKQSALYTDRPDENGQILFDAGGLSHWDRMIIQLEDGAEMEGLEIISPVIATKFKPDFVFPALSIVPKDLSFLDQLQKASAVESYYLENYDQDSLEVVTGFVADHTFLLDDYTRFETVEIVIREYVPSVFVRNQDKKKVFRLVNEAVKSVFDTNPLILIDAMPVFDSDLLSGFNPKFISRLDILNREFYLNDRTYPGVLSFSSYENNFGLYPLAPASRFFDYPGLQPKIELDKSQFARPGSGGEFPDFRTVIYWGKAESSTIEAPKFTGEYLLWVRYTDQTGQIQISKRKITITP
ncbi:hypothetical protein [Algoriphagus litoralis]|uniref:hypothetical protein n=1 Tax=Algoriphagus litoralis TaxID=2202829 RepID=UPI001300514F|nr:hypothetical protein [Algoriphagus litoralis]